MRIHGITHGSRVNGPGLRTVIWLQGCQGMKCPGCWNPGSHPADGGQEIGPELLAERIIANAPVDTEGITISGGEPMQQPYSLLKFLRAIHDIRPSWTVGMFSGYDHVELSGGMFDDSRERPRDMIDFIPTRRVLWRELAQLIHFGIFGRYKRELAIPGDMDYPNHPWLKLCGSLNQRLYIFQHYTYGDFLNTLDVEFSIDEKGLTTLTGFPIIASEREHVPMAEPEAEAVPEPVITPVDEPQPVNIGNLEEYQEAPDSTGTE